MNVKSPVGCACSLALLLVLLGACSSRSSNAWDIYRAPAPIPNIYDGYGDNDAVYIPPRGGAYSSPADLCQTGDIGIGCN